MVSVADIVGYYDAGRKVIPLKGKIPTLPQWNTALIGREDIPRVFREGVNVGWLSDGQADIDCDCPEAIRAARILAPATGMIFGRDSKPRSHYWYTIAGAELPREPFADPLVDDNDAAMLVEYRGKGGQTMAPGSVHDSGERVRFDGEGEPAVIAATDLRWAVAKIAAAAILGRYWNPGARHDATLALVGWLGRYWRDRAEVEQFVAAVHAAGLDDEARDADLASTFERLARREPVTGLRKLRDLIPARAVDKAAEWLNLASQGQDGQVYSPDDLGNAERLRDFLAGDVRHITVFDRFHLCEGGIWLQDKTNTVAARALDVARQLRELAAREPDDRNAKAAFKLATHAASAGGTSAMVKQLSRLDGVRAPHDIWDRDAHLLAVKNGVVDLRTGVLGPHDPELLITRFCNFDYDPYALDIETTRSWRHYLDSTYVDADGYTDDALIFYMQRWCGYLLTGEASEQVFQVLFGESSSGKGVFSRMLYYLFPMHYETINPAALLDGAEQRHATELAGLFGARMVVTSEIQAGQKLATATIKRLSGQDPIKARFMRQDEFTFWPTFKIMMLANERFLVDEDSDGVWRRLHVVKFHRKFRNFVDGLFEGQEAGPLLQPRDTGLEKRLEAEAMGILSWMIMGAQMWYDGGLLPPACVTDAALEYRASQDTLLDFVRARLMPIADVTNESSVMAVFEEWNSFRFKAREEEISVRTFKAKMAARGHGTELRGSLEYFCGLRVRQ